MKVIPFPVLTTPLSYIFLWIASPIAETDVMVSNDASTFLMKGTTTFISEPFSLPSRASRKLPDWIFWDIRALLSLSPILFFTAKSTFI